MRYIYKISNLLFFFFKTRKYNEEKKPRFSWALLLHSAFISEGIITITCDDDVTKDCHKKKETVLMGRFLSQTSSHH